jgi:hypothetical protein
MIVTKYRTVPARHRGRRALTRTRNCFPVGNTAAKSTRFKEIARSAAPTIPCDVLRLMPGGLSPHPSPNGPLPFPVPTGTDSCGCTNPRPADTPIGTVKLSVTVNKSAEQFSPSPPIDPP